MRRGTSWSAGIPLLAALIVMIAAPGRAETYRTLRGTFTTADGRSLPLEGRLDASRFDADTLATGDPEVLTIDDFAFAADGLTWTPRQPIVYDGLTPILLVEIADQIQLDEGTISLLKMRSGGELVAEEAGEVTFRFLELRGDRGDGGRGVGEIGAQRLPRRLHLEGSLYEIEQTFRVLERDCRIAPPAPLPGGGGIVIGGGGALITWGAFEISSQESVHFVAQPGRELTVGRVTGASSSLTGELVSSSGGVTIPTVFIAALDDPPAPTLEELGIRAPSGATVTFENGELSVTTDGDLTVSGDLTALPGLTSLTLVAGGDIVIEGSAQLPTGVTINSGGGAVLVGEPPTAIGSLFCIGLFPHFSSEEWEIGTFSLIATAAEPVEIDVRPGREPNRVHPGSHQWLPVAVLGSPDLDVRDLDPRSLRLGPGEAESLWHWRRHRRGMRLDRDGHADALGFFSVREAGIAFGDPVTCLLARRRDGGLLEGCDAIETLPRGRRRGGGDSAPTPRRK